MGYCKTMWCVSSGEYSDYRILCVAEDRQVAERVTEKLRTDPGSWDRDARVEEIAFADEHTAPETTLRIQQVIPDDGSCGEAHESIEELWPWETHRGAGAECRWRWIRAPVYGGRAGRLEVWGSDLERVRKVFTEKKAALMADPSRSMQIEMKGGR